MNYSDKYFTVVFSDLTQEERTELINHEKFSAGSWSHALDDRDAAVAIPRRALLRMISDLETWCDTWTETSYTDPRISLRLIADRARTALDLQ